jgi:hypothetical protein
MLSWHVLVRCSCWVVGVVALVFFLLPTLGFSLDYDQGMLHYLAWGVLRGLWPYRDIWDTSFPGTILVHTASIALLGNSALAVRIVDFFWQLATAGALYRCGVRLSGRVAGVFAAFAYVIDYRAAGAYETAQRDSFLVLPLLIGLLAYLRFLETRRFRTLALSAACLGVGTLFRPTYVLLALVTAIHLVLDRRELSLLRSPGFRDAVRFTAISASGLLLFVALFFVSGQVSVLGDLLVVFGTVYSTLERLSAARVFGRALEVVPSLAWIGIGASVASLSRDARVVLVAAATCLGIRLFEQKGYVYQFWPFVALLMPLAGLGWTKILSVVAEARRKLPLPRPAIVAAGLALLFLGQFASGQHGGYRALSKVFNGTHDRFASLVGDDPNQTALAALIERRTNSGDKVQLWGPRTGILAAIDRQTATRFTDPFLFCCAKGTKLVSLEECEPTERAPIQLGFRDELMKELRAHPPLYVVAHYADGTLQIEEGPCLAPDLRELRALLDTRYVREATFGNWSAFRRISSE